MAELLIKGGMVIDGTGNAGYEADVFVKDGKIAKIVKIAKNEKKQNRSVGFCSGSCTGAGCKRKARDTRIYQYAFPFGLLRCHVS